MEDLRLVRQSCTAVSVAFDDAAVADHFDEQVDAGLAPERFARVWVHTHPGACPRPSGTDERTFAAAFGGCDWAVMAILAKGGRSYARLRFAAGPGGDLVLPVDVDFAAPFPAADPAGWAAEYARCVAEEPLFSSAPAGAGADGGDLAAAFLAASAEFWPSGVGDFDLSPSEALPEPETWEFHDEHDRGGFDFDDFVS